MIWRSGPELTARELHDLLKLRVDVFVVEQECAYPELDGRDLLATTDHGWILAGDGTIAASVRLLRDGERAQIGRVVTAEAHRGKRLAEQLVQGAHRQAGEQGTFLEAQSYLVGWYERLGWTVDGDEFVEDGIPHTPMARPAEQ